MVCQECGHPAADAAVFCSHCGVQLDRPQTGAAPSVDQVRELLDSARYAAVINSVPATAAPDLAALRATAQLHFDKRVTDLANMYQTRYGDSPPTSRRISSLGIAFRQKILGGEVIDDPQEVHAYVEALLARAKRLIAEGGDLALARRMLYAAQVLPAPQQAAAINSLLATLDGLAQASDLVATSQSSSDVAISSAADADQPAPPDPTTATRKRDLDAAALTVLERLEQLINDRANLPEIVAQLASAHDLIDAGSPYHARLRQAEKRYTALHDDLPEIKRLLELSAAEWLDNPDQLQAQAAAALTRIEAAFESDSALVQELRAALRHTLTQQASLQAQIADLAVLDGPALVEQLRALERVLPAQLPALNDAQARRDAYLGQQNDAKLQEDVRRLRAVKQEEYRLLRLDLDNLYLELEPNVTLFINLREKACEASQNELLPADINPLDPATFAYYDLLFASRYRTRTRPNEKAEQGQTLVGIGDLVGAYKDLLASFAELEQGDDPDAKAGVEVVLQNTIEQLKQQLKGEVTATLNRVADLLDRYDYQAAHQDVQAQRGRLSEAEIAIDEALERRLQEAEERIAGLAKRDRLAREQMETAEASASPDHDSPDFPRALALLDRATEGAPWLVSEISHRRAQIHERRTQFVEGRIQRANIVRQGGTEEDFSTAERLLIQAEVNVVDQAQRDAISKLRGIIDQQQQNRQRLQDMLATARSLAEAAKRGDELELLGARVAAERDRIGPRESPRVDAIAWTELNGYLATTESRIAAWRSFLDLVSQAEQAAFLGDGPTMAELLKRLTAISEHTYLPFKEHISQINVIARQGTKLERARRLIDDIRTDLAGSEGRVTAERLFGVLSNTQDLESDPEIATDRAFLRAILPLYQARDELSVALGRSDFAAFDQLYGALSGELQHSPTISSLKQQADIARARTSFSSEYQEVMRQARGLFDKGWDQPQDFQKAVDLIRALAERTPAGLRDEQERLHPGVIDQLDGLASTLISARADYDSFRYEEAHRRVQTALNDIPLSLTSAKNLLGPYAVELTYLREVLAKKKDDLHIDVVNQGTNERAFQEAVALYIECASDAQRAFRKSDLLKVQNQFMLILAPEHQIKCDRYVATIRQIIELVDLVDDTEELSISGQVADHSEPTPAASGGALRRKLVEAQLKTILERSKEIGSTPEGVPWRGIQDDLKYRTLRANLDLAKALGDADEWASQAKNLGRRYGELRRLRNDAEELRVLNLPGDRSGALRQAGLERLNETCNARWQEIFVRQGKLSAAIRMIEQRRMRNRLGAAALIVVVGVGGAGWRVPSVRERVTVALVGTLTPIPRPTATAAPGARQSEIIVTATALPTLTPIPTPTPVPPQAGVVVVPGRANVRARPNPDLRSVGIVAAGDDVLVTGYSAALDGTRWYRLDVPGRNLRDVWLLAQVRIEGQTYETVRLDNRAMLEPGLELPYNP